MVLQTTPSQVHPKWLTQGSKPPSPTLIYLHIPILGMSKGQPLPLAARWCVPPPVPLQVHHTLECTSTHPAASNRHHFSHNIAHISLHHAMAACRCWLHHAPVTFYQGKTAKHQSTTNLASSRLLLCYHILHLKRRSDASPPTSTADECAVSSDGARLA